MLESIDTLVSLFSAATASLDVSVEDGRPGASEHPIRLTVGTPDQGVEEIGAFTTPAWSFEQSEPEGWGGRPQYERLTVSCSLRIPPLAGLPTPSDVRVRYDEIVTACRSTISGPALGCQVAYMVERDGFQADSPSGWSLVGTFAVVMVSIIR